LAAQPKGKGVPHARLQLGYFSIEENAEALKDELASKGFAAAVEERMRPDKSGEEAKRWIVTVESGAELAKTIQKLKDAGYEAYTIE
jgi:cell division protein FtsN